MQINQIFSKIQDRFCKPKPILKYEADPYEQSRNWILKHSKRQKGWWYKINNIILPELTIKNVNSFIDFMKKEKLVLNSGISVYSNGECVLSWSNEINFASISFLPNGFICIQRRTDVGDKKSNLYTVKLYTLPSEEFDQFVRMIDKEFSITKEQEVRVT